MVMRTNGGFENIKNKPLSEPVSETNWNAWVPCLTERDYNEGRDSLELRPFDNSAVSFSGKQSFLNHADSLIHEGIYLVFVLK